MKVNWAVSVIASILILGGFGFSALDQQAYAESDEPSPTIKITKITTNGDGSFNFTIFNATNPANSTALNIPDTSINDMTTPLTVQAGKYIVIETSPLNWNLISSDCLINDIPQGSTLNFNLINGDTVECIFENTFVGDDDGDGFTVNVDCNDNDNTIFPGAPEVGGDGIDQDCDGFANESLTSLSCGIGTFDNGNGKCDPDVTQAQLDSVKAERDAALAELDNLYTNNSCFPIATSIQETLDCILQLNADLSTAQDDLDTANARIAELEALLGEEDTFTEKECQKFQKTADKAINKGKPVPHGIAKNLETCAILFP